MAILTTSQCRKGWVRWRYGAGIRPPTRSPPADGNARFGTKGGRRGFAEERARARKGWERGKDRNQEREKTASEMIRMGGERWR